MDGPLNVKYNKAVSRTSSQLLLRSPGLHMFMIIMVITVRNARALT
jgi:hypothetical protein